MNFTHYLISTHKGTLPVGLIRVNSRKPQSAKEGIYAKIKSICETDLAEEIAGVPIIQMLEKPVNFSDVVFIASESFEIEALDSGIKETYYIAPVWEF